MAAKDTCKTCVFGDFAAAEFPCDGCVACDRHTSIFENNAELLQALAKEAGPWGILCNLLYYDEYIWNNIEDGTSGWTPQSLEDFFHEEIRSFREKQKCQQDAGTEGGW